MRVASWLVWLLSGSVLGACLLSAGVVVVGGRSMEPALFPGDVCLYVRSSTARVGEIVLVRRSDRSRVIHRVASVMGSDTLVTRGDANAVADATRVKPEMLAGRVVFVLPLGRAYRGWIRVALGATLLNQSHTRR